MPLIRTVFMGTADIAVPLLRALAADSGTEVTAVISQPDRPKGRKLKLQPTPVKGAAEEIGLPVLQPEKCRDPDFLRQLRDWAPDIIVVMAYGQILPPALLDISQHGCLNVHTSILPKYRGAAPIQWAIWNGDAETGVTIMKMDAGMDTGDIVAVERTSIVPDDDAQSVHDRLGDIGARLLVATLPDYVAGRILPRAQTESLATHARKISKEDGRLDWSQSATELWNQIRALTPWPGTFCQWSQDEQPTRLKILRAEPVDGPAIAPGQVMKADREGLIVTCGEGCLRILELQKQGGRRLPVRDFLAGNRLTPGTRLT
jgi:methionyl-tRNA formyltransferase